MSSYSDGSDSRTTHGHRKQPVRQATLRQSSPKHDEYQPDRTSRSRPRPADDFTAHEGPRIVNIEEALEYYHPAVNAAQAPFTKAHHSISPKLTARVTRGARKRARLVSTEDSQSETSRRSNRFTTTKRVTRRRALMPSKHRRTEASHSETDGVAVPATISQRVEGKGHPKRVKRARRLSTEESRSATDEELDRATTAKKATQRSALMQHRRARTMAAEVSEFGSDEGEIDRPASATMAPNPYIGRNLAISASSGSTTDDERAVRPSNLKSRRCRRLIIQSDDSTDVTDKEQDDQTMERTSTKMFDAASAQIITREGRAAAATPDGEHVQRPTPDPRPAQRSLTQLRAEFAARKEELLDAEQKYLELTAETNQQEETLRAEEEALRELQGTAAAIQSHITDFVEHVEIHKAQVADRRAAKERWEERYLRFLARWNETQGDRDALLEDESRAQEG